MFKWMARCYKPAPDLTTVTGMYWSQHRDRWDEPAEPEPPVDTKAFEQIINKYKSTIVLAITAPIRTQPDAHTALKAAGFKPIANGNRAPGHPPGRITLWGKRFERAGKEKRLPKEFYFRCCGARSIKYGPKQEVRKYPIYYSALVVHYVPKTNKSVIPKGFKLFAETKRSRMYVENATRLFKNFDL